MKRNEARWLALGGFSAAIVILASQCIKLIPERDHDGRTAAAIVPCILIAILAFVGLFAESMDDY